MAMIKTHSKAVSQVPVAFPYQSYFDSGLLEKALQVQSTGDSIVASTKQFAQSPGVGVALHPSSACPIAIKFRGGSADSAEIILTPGQSIYVGEFNTFEWGLPFGWLGGGTSLLYIIHQPDAKIDFGGTIASVVPFHRTRLVIEGAFPGALRKNFPGTFPWASALMGTGPTPQDGSPIINVEPEIAMCRLRSAIVAPATLTFVWRGADDLDTDSNGVDQTTDLTLFDLPFPSMAGGGGFPVAWLPPEVHRLVSSVGGVNVIDPSGALAGAFIDVVRYAKLA